MAKIGVSQSACVSRKVYNYWVSSALQGVRRHTRSRLSIAASFSFSHELFSLISLSPCSLALSFAYRHSAITSRPPTGGALTYAFYVLEY